MPTLGSLALAHPFSAPAACRISHAVGGLLTSKLKERSGLTVTTVGMGTPGLYCAVRALNSLQKSMALTPLEPSAGPTGGEGVAWPAPTISLTSALLALPSFLDMVVYVRVCVNKSVRVVNDWREMGIGKVLFGG